MLERIMSYRNQSSSTCRRGSSYAVQESVKSQPVKFPLLLANHYKCLISPLILSGQVADLLPEYMKINGKYKNNVSNNSGLINPSSVDKQTYLSIKPKTFY